MTQPGRLGQECRADDLDEIEAPEQRGAWDQHVRRPARPAAGPTEALAPAAVRAAQLALAREPPRAEHPIRARRALQVPAEELRLDLRRSVPDRKHTQILLSTSESSRAGVADGKSQLVLRMVERCACKPQASAPLR